MNSTVRVFSGLYEWAEIRNRVHLVGVSFCGQDVHDSLANPLPHIHPQGVRLADVRWNAYDQFSFGVTGFQCLVDPFDPGRHDVTACRDLSRVKECHGIAVIIQLEFEPVDRIVFEHLLDECKTFVANFLVFEVQVGCAFEVFQISTGTNFQMHVVPAIRRTAHVVFARFGSSSLIHQQGGVDQYPQFSGPFTDDSQRVLSRVDHHPDVLSGATKNRVIPAIHRIPPDFSDLGVVKHGPSVSQSKHQSLNGGSRHFVDCRFELFLLHRWFIHVGRRVAAVIEKHDPGLFARRAVCRGGGLSRLGGRNSTGDGSCSQSRFHEFASFHRSYPFNADVI